MTTSTQARFMDALDRGVRDRKHMLVTDTQWANTGTVYAVVGYGLTPVGAILKYDFQDGGRMAFSRMTDIGRTEVVAALSSTGTVDWCYKTAEEVLDVVLDALVPPPPDGRSHIIAGMVAEAEARAARGLDGWADVEIEGSFAAHLIYDDDAERLVVEHFTFVPNQDAKTYLLDGTVDDDWDIADVDGPFWKAVQEYLRDNTSPGPYANVLWVE